MSWKIFIHTLQFSVLANVWLHVICKYDFETFILHLREGEASHPVLVQPEDVQTRLSQDSQECLNTCFSALATALDLP